MISSVTIHEYVPSNPVGSVTADNCATAPFWITSVPSTTFSEVIVTEAGVEDCFETFTISVADKVSYT